MGFRDAFIGDCLFCSEVFYFPSKDSGPAVSLSATRPAFITPVTLSALLSVSAYHAFSYDIVCDVLKHIPLYVQFPLKTNLWCLDSDRIDPTHTPADNTASHVPRQDRLWPHAKHLPPERPLIPAQANLSPPLLAALSLERWGSLGLYVNLGPFSPIPLWI